MKPSLFIDLDNTIVNFNGGFKDTFKELYEESLEIDESSYDLLSVYKGILPPEEIKAIYHAIFTRKNFWLNLLPYKGACEIISRLNKHFDLYICSKPYNEGDMQCTSEKLLWVKEYLPFINTTDQVIFMSNKGLLDEYERIIIEDNIENLRSWSKGTTIKFEQPYNLFYKADYNAKSWYDIWNIMKETYLEHN